MSTPFQVKNESLLPIYNIKQDWFIEVFRVGFPGSETHAYEVQQITPRPDRIIPRLGSSEAVTVYPFGNLKVKEAANGLKLVTDVTFETAIFHRHETKDFFFEGNEGTDGKFYWYHTDKPR